VHFVGFPAVLAQRKPTVVTVHDLTFKTRPETRGDLISRFHWEFFGVRGARRADHVITISQNTQRDIQHFLNVPEERISVIYEAAASIFRPVEPESARITARGKYGIEGRYILFVGTLEPIKNLSRLIEAYALARQRGMTEPSLVVVGQKGWQFADIFARVERLGLQDEIVFTGFVPDEDLPALYSGADVFVMPSLYEGFGLPVLEAMACGTPVLTSDVSSLPEIASDAAILVNPMDVDALAEALERVCGDDYLRQNMRLAGLARAAQFSWRRCAEETREVYRRVASMRVNRG
jgi:glycosyltransferase involved in cell wall biosynthesis